MSRPYDKTLKRRWWKSAVAGTTPETVEDLYRKRWEIDGESRIATAGSCFAQHIARHLRQNGFQIHDGEPAPFGMAPKSALTFSYGVYSCRYGNIYHARHLRQLVEEALSGRQRSDLVWETRGRFRDAFRPTIEPDGLDSAEEVLAHRADHLRAVRRMLESASVFVFTFGLTEAWVDAGSGDVYPTFPGVFDTYDPDRHVFRNFRTSEIVEDFLETRRLIHGVNPDMRFILTVSPVPLIATATDSHVLTATTASKSILRAAVQELYELCDDVDYFPSYEIISAPWSKGRFFEADQRNVTEDGVRAVMRVFFEQHRPLGGAMPVDAPEPEALVCDEVLIERFGHG